MRARIYLKSFSKSSIQEGLKSFSDFLTSCEKLTFYSVSLPTKIKRFCVLRSPHIDKDSREEFEICVYKRFIDIKCDDIYLISNAIASIKLPHDLAIFIRLI